MGTYYLMMLVAVVLLAVSNCLGKQYQRLTSGYNNVECSLRKTVPLSVISAAMYLCLSGFKLRYTGFSVAIALVLCVVNVVAHLVIFKGYAKGSVSLFTMFQMQGGMILPFIYGAIFADNELTAFKICGIVIMIFALILPHVNRQAERGGTVFIILCVAIFLLNGSISIFSYVHSNSPNATDNNSFLFLLNLLIGGVSAVVYAVYCVKNKNNMMRVKPDFTRRERVMIWVLIIGSAIASGVSYLLQLYSAAKLPAVTAYPMITGGTVVFMAFAGIFLFKEKFDARSLISIIATFLATVLFMF